MNLLHETIQWLLQGDPAIRWQTLRDLVDVPGEEVEQERQMVAQTGWGARLLSFQEPSGMWGGGLYTPKWISTTYSMLLLRRMGLPPGHPQAMKACELLLNNGFYRDGGINFFAGFDHSETCVTGMILSILACFHFDDDRLHDLVEHLLRQQLPDGGWNCQAYNGASHSSFHTTISVLEGLREYEKFVSHNTSEVEAAQQKGRGFLLVHRLFRSHRTGDVANPVFTRFSFPPRWHYDVLRGLDYFQECRAERDDRLEDALGLVVKKRKKNGKWLLQNRHPGKVFFEMEKAGEPSRWNSLRALRVLKWLEID